MKIENVPPEPSTSQVKKNKADSVNNQDMLDMIGALFNTKTKTLSTDLTNKIDDNAKSMTNKIENNAQEIKSDVAKQIKVNTENITDYLVVFKKKVEMV